MTLENAFQCYRAFEAYEESLQNEQCECPLWNEVLPLCMKIIRMRALDMFYLTPAQGALQCSFTEAAVYTKVHMSGANAVRFVLNVEGNNEAEYKSSTKNPTAREGCSHGTVVIYSGVKALGRQQQTSNKHAFSQVCMDVLSRVMSLSVKLPASVIILE